MRTPTKALVCGPHTALWSYAELNLVKRLAKPLVSPWGAREGVENKKKGVGGMRFATAKYVSSYYFSTAMHVSAY